MHETEASMSIQIGKLNVYSLSDFQTSAFDRDVEKVCR